MVAMVGVGILVTTKPDRRAHEQAIQELVLRKIRFSDSGFGEEIFGKSLLSLTDAATQSDHLDYIDLFGFQYEDMVIMSAVFGSKSDNEVVSVGLLNTVKISDETRPNESPD